MSSERWLDTKSARFGERANTGWDTSLACPADGENPPTSRRHAVLVPTALLAVAILLVSANLRPAVTGLSPVLDEIRDSLHTSAAWISVLTALPGLCFGLAGFLAPPATRLLGLSRAIGASVALLAIGLVVRVSAGPVLFLAGTLLACIGIAVCNVLIPVVIKESYPNRIGLLTGMYTATLQAFAALGSLFTAPVAEVTGTWRAGVGMWGLLAVVALLLWAVGARHGRTAEWVAAGRAGGWAALLRNRLAWMVTLFFGLQAMLAYIIMGWLPQVLMSAGVDRTTAGLMMAVAGVLGVPISLLLVPIAVRQRSQSAWVMVLTTIGGAGVLGLILAPAAAPWLWSVCLGIGMGVFAIAVAFISLRTRSVVDTRRLSTMSQSIGYLLAAVGPLLFGLLHGLSGSWTVSLYGLLAGVVVQVLVGWSAGRPRSV